MRLACRLVGERVDDAERRRAEPNGKPWFRAGFLLDEGQRRQKKFLDCAFFAGLGLEPYQQCLCSHGCPRSVVDDLKAPNVAAAAECPLTSETTMPSRQSR